MPVIPTHVCARRCTRWCMGCGGARVCCDGVCVLRCAPYCGTAPHIHAVPQVLPWSFHRRVRSSTCCREPQSAYRHRCTPVIQCTNGPAAKCHCPNGPWVVQATQQKALQMQFCYKFTGKNFVVSWSLSISSSAQVHKYWRRWGIAGVVLALVSSPMYEKGRSPCNFAPDPTVGGGRIALPRTDVQFEQDFEL